MLSRLSLWLNKPSVWMKLSFARASWIFQLSLGGSDKLGVKRWHYALLPLQPVLVITTGKQTKDQGVYTPLDVASNRIQSEESPVFSLGIGKDVDSSELDKIASEPDNVFTVDSYQELDNKVKDVKRALCIGIVDYSPIYWHSQHIDVIQRMNCFR